MKHAKLSPNAVCVFCSSSFDLSPQIKADGRAFGENLAGRGVDLVYGGTTCGLMGIVANAHKAAGGKVIGVIPKLFLDRGIQNDAQDETVLVDDLRGRKSAMSDRSGAFAVLPGGLGTFDEFFEILALKQIGFHEKPIALLNTEGYYDPLLALLRAGIERKTLKNEHLSLFTMVNTPDEAIAALGLA